MHQIFVIPIEVVAVEFQLLVAEGGQHFAGVLLLAGRDVCAQHQRAGYEADHFDAVLFHLNAERIVPEA